MESQNSIDPAIYLKYAKEKYARLPKQLPVLWRYIFSRRYILPQFRQPDYVSQEACDYMLLDAFRSYLERKTPLSDHVSAHCMNNFIVAMKYNRPTFFLERELCIPLLKGKLPLDFYTSDINWRWPAFRVYLPRNLLTIHRNGADDGMMYLDISRTFKGYNTIFPSDLDAEIKRIIAPRGKIPMMTADFEGMCATGVMDFQSSTGPIAYATSCKLERQTIRQVMDQLHEPIQAPLKSDELDTDFHNRMLALSINILLFLSSIPTEYEPEERILRKASMDGKHPIPGLYPARFIGQSQLRPMHHPEAHLASIPTGKQTSPHWVSGHWKRQPYGPKGEQRKLIWIGIYHTGDELTDVKSK